MKILDENSQRTNVLKKITLGFWLLTALLVLLSILLVSNFVNGSVLSGVFAVINGVAVFVSLLVALFFTLVTNGSKRFDLRVKKQKTINKKNVIDL